MKSIVLLRLFFCCAFFLLLTRCLPAFPRGVVYMYGRVLNKKNHHLFNHLGLIKIQLDFDYLYLCAWCLYIIMDIYRVLEYGDQICICFPFFISFAIPVGVAELPF